MNTTNKQDETLEVAYSKHKEKYSHFMPDEQSESMLSFSFEEGAKWQKEQDKVIIDKLAHQLKMAKSQLSSLKCSYNKNQIGYIETTKEINDIELLLQSLKPETKL